jgi:hypothetical protein
MKTTKSRMQNVRGCKQTYEPEKLYHEEQKKKKQSWRLKK